MKIVIAPDSFKGTMSAVSVCETAKRVLSDRYPDARIVCVPVADGGEGTVDAFCFALPLSERRTYAVKDLFGRPVNADVCFNGKTAIVETACAAGIDHSRLDVCHATTAGLGDVIRHVLDDGAEKIVLGLGGSGTTDCGIGLASSLGARFYDSAGKEVALTGEGLAKIEQIDLSGLDKRLQTVEILAACDVQIPLYGPRGTAYGYSRQKGATEEDVVRLDRGVKHFADLILKEYHVDLNTPDGSGAAGGLGAAVRFFLGGHLVPGIDLVLNTVGFEEICRDADVVITGEGCADAQSVSGKVPVGVAAVAKKTGRHVVCLCGRKGDGWEKLFDHGLDEIVCINPPETDFETAKKNCLTYLADTLRTLTIRETES